MNAHELVSNLKGFTGTEHYYRHNTLLLTDGAKFLAEKAGAFWLIDLIFSYSSCAWFKDETFLVCKIKVTDNRAMVALEDGNDNVYMEQFIEYTDFPLKEYRLFIVLGKCGFVVMLPGEY